MESMLLSDHLLLLDNAYFTLGDLLIYLFIFLLDFMPLLFNFILDLFPLVLHLEQLPLELFCSFLFLFLLKLLNLLKDFVGVHIMIVIFLQDAEYSLFLELNGPLCLLRQALVVLSALFGHFNLVLLGHLDVPKDLLFLLDGELLALFDMLEVCLGLLELFCRFGALIAVINSHELGVDLQFFLPLGLMVLLQLLIIFLDTSPALLTDFLLIFFVPFNSYESVFVPFLKDCFPLLFFKLTHFEYLFVFFLFFL